MRSFLPSLLFLIFSGFCHSQTTKAPSNLKQAVKQLNISCPDSLKYTIKNTDDDKLSEINYPSGKFKMIYEWTTADRSKLTSYLARKGIKSHRQEVVLLAFKKFLLGHKINEDDILSPYQEIEKKWDNEDRIRFTTDSLRGIYIPNNLEDCIKQINLSIKDSVKQKISGLSENEFTGRNHMGYGMWMRNNWGLWGGSRLSKFFNDLGIFHPDDMSGIILKSYYRALTGRDLELEKQIQNSKDYWEEVKTRQLEIKKEEFSEYKIGDIVNFTYPEGYVSQTQEDFYDDDICIATGEITDLNEKDFYIKVKLIESCDKKGIIYYDNEDVVIYNKKTDQMESPKKRTIKRLKKGKEMWFEYGDWETQ